MGPRGLKALQVLVVGEKNPDGLQEERPGAFRYQSEDIPSEPLDPSSEAGREVWTKRSLCGATGWDRYPAAERARRADVSWFWFYMRP